MVWRRREGASGLRKGGGGLKWWKRRGALEKGDYQEGGGILEGVFSRGSNPTLRWNSADQGVSKKKWYYARG